MNHYVRIDGLLCRNIMRGNVNGLYRVSFHRDNATLEQIEAINWAKPKVTGIGDCILPIGYGFEAVKIEYESCYSSYTVTVKVGKQYLGDVTEYLEKIDQFTKDMAEVKEMVAGLENVLDESVAALEDALCEMDMANAEAGNIDLESEKITTNGEETA